MTPLPIPLVQDSFRGVVPIAGLAAGIFYNRRFEAAPGVRKLFLAELGD